jgi:hypothetical protein
VGQRRSNTRLSLTYPFHFKVTIAHHSWAQLGPAKTNVSNKIMFYHFLEVFNSKKIEEHVKSSFPSAYGVIFWEH